MSQKEKGKEEKEKDGDGRQERHLGSEKEAHQDLGNQRGKEDMEDMGQPQE